jgi:hypothetical protein
MRASGELELAIKPLRYRIGRCRTPAGLIKLHSADIGAGVSSNLKQNRRKNRYAVVTKQASSPVLSADKIWWLGICLFSNTQRAIKLKSLVGKEATVLQYSSATVEVTAFRRPGPSSSRVLQYYWNPFSVF